MLCSTPPLERARPLLGTTVAIRVRGLDSQAAQDAIESGFAAVARVDALMSFHDAGSDVSRLNRTENAAPVAVDPATFAVLAEARRLSELSDGLFDISIGAQMQARGLLPPCQFFPAADPEANWRHIELLDDGRVRFLKPLRIDLGGIAKGFAVDRAIEVLAFHGVEHACVNAGGDLRVLGDVAERVHLRTGAKAQDHAPLITLANGSIASSGSLAPNYVSPHIGANAQRFAAVAAERCLIADALTKIAIAQGAACEALLCELGATAFLCEASERWQVVGAQQ